MILRRAGPAATGLRQLVSPPLRNGSALRLSGCPASTNSLRTFATKVSAAHTERMGEATVAWSDRWTQLVEWEQAADTAATQSRIAHWGKKRLRAEGHMMVRQPQLLALPFLPADNSHRAVAAAGRDGGSHTGLRTRSRPAARVLS